MKALTIKQPWASLIAHGIKDIENRTWKTNFRGRIFIHASKIGTDADFTTEQTAELYTNEIWNPDTGFKSELFPVSEIIGEVDIIDCVINHDSIWAEKSQGIWVGSTFVHKEDHPVIWNWVLANPVLYDKPMLNVKGKLSFWEPGPNTVCMNCGDPFFGQEPQYCCNGRDCGCMGQPTEPLYCDKCYQLTNSKK